MPRVTRDVQISIGEQTYVVLCELVVSADTRIIDNTGRVTGLLFATLCQEAQECGGDEEDGRHIYGVQLRPRLEGLIIEKCATKRLW